MIKLKHLATATALTFGSLSLAQAATVDEQGAQSLKETLVGKSNVNSTYGKSVTVKPDGNRYAIVFDAQRLVDDLKIKDLVIRGLKAFTTYATPRDDSTWQLESNDNFDLSGTYKGDPARPTDFRYVIGSTAFQAIWDPAITYLRTADLKAQNLQIESKTNDDVFAVRVSDMIYKINTSDADGRQNINTDGSMSDFSEKITQAKGPPVDIHAEKVLFDSQINGIDMKKLGDLANFAVANLKNEEALKKGIPEKASAAFPLLASYNQNIKLQNISVGAQGSEVGGAREFAYGLFADGPSNKTRIGLRLSARDINVSTPAMPDVFKTFLPDVVDAEASVPNLDFAAFWNEFAARNYSFGGAGAKDEAMVALLPNKTVSIELPKMIVHSSVYDFEVTGSGSTLVGKGQPQVEAKFTVLARDLDKTIAALQEVAKVEPNSNNASMGLLVAKGFAKTDPDGRLRWEVAVNPDGSVDVNGQQLKGPNPAAPETQP